MKFALVNGHKTEPQPKLHGICAHCQSETHSKCGDVKVWHWAHKSKVSCDPWWENETEWHRAWKKLFPVEWQEVGHCAPSTGERHIADVKTVGGYVLEFQHSAIQPTEMKSRETFYKNMIWIVDGARLKRDYPRFLKGAANLKQSIQRGIFLVHFPEECFPPNWLNCSVPVYFDFQGTASSDTPNMTQEPLWALFPDRIEGQAVVAAVSREQFIDLSFNKPHLLLAHQIISAIRQQRAGAAIEAQNFAYQQLMRKPIRRRYRL